MLFCVHVHVRICVCIYVYDNIYSTRMQHQIHTRYHESMTPLGVLVGAVDIDVAAAERSVADGAAEDAVADADVEADAWPVADFEKV